MARRDSFLGRLQEVLPPITPADRRAERDWKKFLQSRAHERDPNAPAYLPTRWWERAINRIWWLFTVRDTCIPARPNEAMKKQWAEAERVRQTRKEEDLKRFGPDPVQPLVASTFLGKCKFLARYAWFCSHSLTGRTFFKAYGIPWGLYNWKMVKYLDILTRKAMKEPDKNSGLATYKSLKIIGIMLDRKYHIRERQIPDGSCGYIVPSGPSHEDDSAYWRIYTKVTNKLGLDMNFGFAPLSKPGEKTNDVSCV